MPDLDYSHLTNAEKLELPEEVDGSLNPSGLRLPVSIGGNLFLWGLTSADGLTLPESIGGNLNLSGLTSAEGSCSPCPSAAT